MTGDWRAGRIGWCGVLALATLVGCGRAASSGAPQAPAPAAASLASSDSCWLAPPPSEPADSLLIVVDHRAVAIDDGRHLIESLTALLPVRADCAGRAVPALSVRWQADSAAQPHRLVPIEQMPGLPVLRIASLAPGADARDAIDHEADLLITQDPDVVRYAAVRGDRLIVPLPARRTYGVLTIAGDSWVQATDRLTLHELQALRESLARDVVPAAAVAVSDAAREPVRCPMAIGSPRGRSADLARRLVHRADDPVARALAERLVSLAARPDDAAGRLLAAGARPMTATGMDSAAFAAELSAGGSSAFVVAWPSSHGDACDSLGSVGGGEPRLSSKYGAAPAAEVTALIGAAAWAIVRQGAVGLVRDAAGETRLVVTVIDPAASSP